VCSLYIGMSNSLTFGSCDSNDFGPNSQGPQGAQGAQGIPGPQGLQGPPGQDGIGGTLLISLTSRDVTDKAVERTMLEFEAGDGFTLTGARGPSAIIGLPKLNELENYLFNQPSPVENPSYNSTATQINLLWNINTPAQVESSFAVAPSSLGQDFDYLPYISGFELGFLEDLSDATWYTITDASLTTQQAANAVSWTSYVSTNTPNGLNKVEITNSPNSSRTYPTNLEVYLENNLKINLTDYAVGKSFRFRFAFTNQSAEPKNYVYFPSETGYLSFGQYGHANAPSSITLTNAAYNRLEMFGLGSTSGMDASLNAAYGEGSLTVQYGVDVTGSKRSGAIQYGGEIAAVGSTYFTNPGINTERWPSQSTNHSLNTIAYPEYEYETVNTPSQSYFARNSTTDFSNVDIFAASSVKSTISLPIPTRTQVGASDFLTSASNQSLTVTGAGTQYTVLQRQNNYVLLSLYLVDQSRQFSLAPSGTTSWNVGVNYGDSTENTTSWVTSNSMLGTDASNQNLTYFQLSIPNTNIPNLSSNWKMGFDPSQDVAEIPSSTNLSFSVAQMSDAGTYSAKTGGYFLETTISSFSASNLTLTEVPDVSNNGVSNNQYNPYNFTISQYVNDITQSIVLTREIEYPFHIGEAPSKDISYINYSLVMISPSRAGYFYGLALPSTVDFEVAFQLNDLHLEYCPTSTSIITVSLGIHESSNNNFVEADNSSIDWTSTGTNSTYNFSDTLKMTYATSSSLSDYDIQSYSRDFDAGDQFQIISTINNNITRSNPAHQITRTTDLSLNNLALWWDYTWTGGEGLPQPDDLPNITKAIGMSKVELLDVSTGTMPFNESTNPSNNILMNVVSSDFNFVLPSNQAMWSKDAWYGASKQSPSEWGDKNPYIDYTNSFHTSSVITMQDYSSFNQSGDTKNIVYSNGMYYDTTNADYTYTNIKWLGIKATMSSTSTAGQALSITVQDSGSNNLTLGSDYLLFYKEEIQGSGTPYTWSGETSGSRYTPWLDGAAIWQSNLGSLVTFSGAQSLSGQEATGNGVSQNVSTANGFKVLRLQTVALYQYFLFGIPEGTSIKSIIFSLV
jgi:hypothetical protein